MELRAPAKTNLILEVPRKRADGFHELDTVFAALELADRLVLEPAAALELVVEDPSLAGPDNLVLRAAEALRAAAGRPELGARIELHKEIPAGGGLGGGSSDAAATLRGLNALWELGLPHQRLAELAAELGSDVAFFLRGGLQRGRGRGELLEVLPPAPALDLVLLFPPFGCPTGEVYRALAPHLPSQPRDAERLIEALPGGAEAVAGELFNRLALPAYECFPQLAELEQDLSGRAGCLAVLLSGSGSTLVALCRDTSAARALATELQREGRRAVATRTVSGSSAPRG